MFALAVHPEKLHPGTQCHMSLQAAKEITKQGKPTLVGSMQIFMVTFERSFHMLVICQCVPAALPLRPRHSHIDPVPDTKQLQTLVKYVTQP